MPIVARSPLDRFMEKVQKSDGCWLWTGTKVRGRYGWFFIKKSAGKTTWNYAHRWSYEHHVGPIPAGLEIDHLCRVTACVNPDHLEPVTRAENLRRTRATHCFRGHERPEGDARGANCKRCQQIRDANRPKRKRH